MQEPNTSSKLISSEIEFAQLPPFFQRGMNITDSPVSADMLMIALLTATSSMLPRFYFHHGFPEHKYRANLMSLVIAPPAGGKGIMNLTNRLVDWHDHMIAGNSSLSAFLSELERMEGRAYMMETEADVMSRTLRVDNNDYSYILRQAWEGETIRRARDGRSKQRIVIREPQLSFLLSGTLNQLQPLLRSQANGLTSRMLCYLVTEIQGFDSRVFGQDIVEEMPNVDEVYATLTNYVQALYDWQMSADHDCRFRLTDEQAEQLTTWFSDSYELMMDLMKMPVGFDATMKRLAVTVMRIGLILSAVRLRTEGEFPRELVCTDEDFQSMLLIAEKLLAHMVDVFALLPEEDTLDTDIVMIDRHAEAKMRQQLFLSKLDDTFTTADMRNIAKKEGITFKTAERWATQWLKEGFIVRVEHGHYKKS